LTKKCSKKCQKNAPKVTKIILETAHQVVVGTKLALLNSVVVDTKKIASIDI
jgi:hypothetical protein